jgi:hypothetical protein
MVHTTISIVLLHLIGVPWLQRLLVCSSNGVRLLHGHRLAKCMCYPQLKNGPQGSAPGAAGLQELEAQLDGVPEGWGDMPGYMDVVAENSTAAGEIDC